MTITAELRQAVAQSQGEPLRIEDPETHQSFVLLSADVYDRMRALLSEEEDIDPSFFEIDDFEPISENP